MKKTLLVASVVLGFIAVSHAAIVDDFESYTEAGNIAADTGGVWNGIPDFTGNPDIADDGAGNQYLTNFATTTNRGAYSNLVANAVTDTYITTLVFDMYLETASQDTSFGLANGGTDDYWSDFEAYIGITNTALTARNAGVVEDLGQTLNVGQWYSITIVADTGADTYDVYLDALQVASDLVFRNSGAGTVVEDLDALKIMSNPGTDGSSNDLVRIDNINMTTVVPEPATLLLLGLGGILIRRRR